MPMLFKSSYAIKSLALFKTRRKFYGLSNDKLIVLSIADCQGK